MATRKVYAAKLAVVEQDRVITVLSIGPFPSWTKLLRKFLEDYEEAPSHQWSVLVDADLDGKGKDTMSKEQNVLWSPMFFKGIEDLIKGSEQPAPASAEEKETQTESDS
jgi:hypothetical protein